MIVAVIGIATIALGVLLKPPPDLVSRVVEFLSPLFAMFITIGILLGFATLIISLFVQISPQRFVVRQNR